MVCPNLSGYKASFDFYFEPWSNLYGWMSNDTRLSTEETINKSRFTYEFGASYAGDAATSPLQPLYLASNKAGSLLDYCGVPVGFFGDVNESEGGNVVTMRAFPAEKVLSVLDVYRHYYVNNQEDKCYFLNEWAVTNSASPVLGYPLETLDNLFQQLRNLPDGGNLSGLLDNGNQLDEGPLNFFQNIIRASSYSPLGGLPLRTYRMDMNRGILNNAIGEFKSSVRVTDNSFDIDTLRFANKLQKLIDRIDISGGRFADMMRVRWGVKPRGAMHQPDYLGSVSSFFGVTDIVSTASGTNDNVQDGRGNSVLGQQAGFAVGRVNRDNNPISFRADNYGTLVCIFSLTPIVTYSQGIEIEDIKTTFSEIYDPAFSQLGYQDVNPVELSVFPKATVVKSPNQDIFLYQFDQTSPLFTGESVGKRIAWSEYMSALPRAHGLFAFGEDFDYWVNNRLYTRYNFPVGDPENLPFDNVPLSFVQKLGQTDYSTYIAPDLVNNLFTDTSLTAQNFRLRVTFDMDWRREIGSRVMPHL